MGQPGAARRPYPAFWPWVASVPCARKTVRWVRSSTSYRDGIDWHRPNPQKSVKDAERQEIDVLDSLREGLQNAVSKILKSNVVDEKVTKEFVRDLQRTLIQSDVNVKIALEVTERVQKRALEEKPPGGVTRKDQVVSILYEELARLLGGEGELRLDKEKTNLLVMLGVQGSGKTTTTAKLSRL